jgi:hypothetical protein
MKYTEDKDGEFSTVIRTEVRITAAEVHKIRELLKLMNLPSTDKSVKSFVRSHCILNIQLK